MQDADVHSSSRAGVVLDIQRSALHDGPGIRTTVFLKGCPLRCVWCHNPESWRCAPENGVGEFSGKRYGRTMTVEEIMAIVRRDLAFYRNSGGGITVSGGEPALQTEFCLELLRAAKAEGIHTCLDTSGYFSAAVRERLRPWVDLYLYDLKATGEDLHRRLTGVSAESILANLHDLLQAGADVWLRCPMVPSLNDDENHLHAIASLSRNHPNLRIELLPYHRSGVGKWRELGLESLNASIEEPTPATRQRWRHTLAAAGAVNVHCAP